MRAAVNLVLTWSAIAAIEVAPALASADEAEQSQSRWVPSLALTSGIFVQDQKGEQSSLRFEGPPDPPTSAPLRPAAFGNDRVVAPYVGGVVELMSPALPFATSPRFFASGEFLPTFASERGLAIDGEPARIRGPEVGAVLAGEEDSRHYTDDPVSDGPRPQTFPLDAKSANGQGMRAVAQIDRLTFGAKVGMAFAFELRGRQMRIKPSAGWIHYKVGVKGLLVHPTCRLRFPPPETQTACTNLYGRPSEPGGSGALLEEGFLRESLIIASDSGEFDGVGPGVDLEMDTGRYGPIGTSLFLGVHAYYIPGDRDIAFGNSRSYSDEFGDDIDTASWRVRVAPWVYRAGVGIRFHWLGSSE